MIINPYENKTFLKGIISTKTIMISLMVATFMVFASGSSTLNAGEELFSIVIGAGFFTLASTLLIWAGDVSRKLYR